MKARENYDRAVFRQYGDHPRLRGLPRRREDRRHLMMAAAHLQSVAGGDQTPPVFGTNGDSQTITGGFENSEAHHGQAS
jgi:hypothetical protein